MDVSNYKVIFSGIKKTKSEAITLTFREMPLKYQFEISASLLQKIREKSEEGRNIIHFRNIEDVTKLGDDAISTFYDNFYVVLYSTKEEGKKEGILLVTIKKKGTLLIGTWPFNIAKRELTKENVNQLLGRFIDNPEEFKTICIIT